ncbi:MAG: hypothetical protein QM647_04165 [Asticcacaulis sp.]|uniref:hypothetical protein n=1 Tax=Asticcacaulis sp. TaxID=1872648 RepID=UPI0039E542F0
MKFSEPVRAAEGLTSYARVRRVQWGPLVLSIVEGLLGLLGVVLLILVFRYGSFEKAGLTIDQGIDWLKIHASGHAAT